MTALVAVLGGAFGSSAGGVSAARSGVSRDTTRSTSSSVVRPWAALSMPSSRRVRIPARFAAFLITWSAARLEIKSRISSVTASTSWMAIRPLRPDCSHWSHPCPATHRPSDGSRDAPPIFSIASALGCWRIAHPGHGRRTSRCATMPRSDEAIRKGWMPRSNRRVMVAVASLVCSVLRSR